MQFSQAKPASGFTLIELMIVVAIIGIMAAVAIPAYQDYVARAQVSEAVRLLGGAKTPLSEYFADNGEFPDTVQVSLPNVSGSYVSLVTYEAMPAAGSGTLTVVALMRSVNVNASIAGKTMLLETSDGGKTWDCNVGTIASEHAPAGCR